MYKHCFFYLFLAFALVAAFVSCEEKESDLGIGLQDPSTIYNGIVDTAFGTAYMVLDDSLLTTSLNSAIIGSGTDANIASTEASFYSNISTPNGASVSFDENCTIDSVVLSLAVSGVYVSSADSSGSQNVHFTIKQLSHRLYKDSAYYSTSVVAESGTTFFDDDVTIQRGDTMVVRMKLSNDFISLIDNQSYSTSDDFENAVKGIHVKLGSTSSDHQYVVINLAASTTRLTVYYTYNSGGSLSDRTYDFAFGTSVTHFSRFDKNFLGDCITFNSNRGDSIRQAALYVSPLGGTNIRFNIDPFVKQFHKDHPLAIIHYAELLLPVDVNAPADRPESLAAIKLFQNGVVANIPDMYDPYTYSGFDGSYDADRQCYRMRVTQHLQDLVRDGNDRGTLIVVNGRRTSWEHTVVCGDNAANPIRIVFVYSE